jgi:hypothetical protein
MSGGSEGRGPAGLGCNTCHQAENVLTHGGSIASIPGDPHWSLAPASMAWQSQSLGEICRQLKDPARNVGRSLEQIHTHMAEDHRVGWGWRPGPERVPAPGTQQGFGQLIGAWIESGAACPP